MAEIEATEPPFFPVYMTWGEDTDSYDSLEDLGTYLQFLREGEFGAGDSFPIFIDSTGVRYRIVIISLEVVLCLPVPKSFKISDLTLMETHLPGGRAVLEMLGDTPHRALGWSASSRPGTTSEPKALPLERVPLENVGWKASSMPWAEFDLLWFEASIPPFSFGLPKPFRRALRWLLG